MTFLERVFLKLMLNFTWWVNRKDSTGKNLFEGGFLGLDNIGVFDRRCVAKLVSIAERMTECLTCFQPVTDVPRTFAAASSRRACTWSRRTARHGWACTA